MGDCSGTVSTLPSGVGCRMSCSFQSLSTVSSLSCGDIFRVERFCESANGCNNPIFWGDCWVGQLFVFEPDCSQYTCAMRAFHPIFLALVMFERCSYYVSLFSVLRMFVVCVV